MRTFVKGALLTLALSLCAWQLLPASRAGVQEGAEDKQSESTPAGQRARAKSLFTDRCARCHGADGRGRTVLGEMLAAPDFTDEGWWQDEKSERRLIQSIAGGKGEMPAFAKKLSRREISSLADYVRGFRKADR